MKTRHVMYGILTVVVAGIASALLQNWRILRLVTGLIGVGGLLFVGMKQGVTSGNIYRFTAPESESDRARRQELCSKIMSYSLPSLVTFIVSSYVYYR